MKSGSRCPTLPYLLALDDLDKSSNEQQGPQHFPTEFSLILLFRPPSHYTTEHVKFLVSSPSLCIILFLG